ncbi:MAG TPA: DNA ligase D, partial [Myxococcota bacterium]|nr:DNA ligase D [Myxococcota bacterium]
MASAHGSLSTYRKKRDFGVTAEPRGTVARPGKRLAFVVQKHAARRLHYDLRLELEGTLKSWAVPKGPSLDPRIRRMAVHVEDHPLGYGKFEGVIPPGQYGAGTVIVWDRGTWAPVGDAAAGYRAGKLKFDLDGEKLHGRWNLVRIRNRAGERQEPWLLIKEDDGHARPASEYDVVEALPQSVLRGAQKAAKAKPARPAAKAKPAAKSRSGPGTKAARGTRTPKAAAPKAAAIPKGAVEADLPLFLAPQLATLVDEAPADDGWIYEIKFDGYRLVARIDGDDVRLFTRNGNDWTARLKGLRDEVRALGLASGWLDGEIVVLGPDGRPDFQALQNAFDDARTGDIVYSAFDLPHFSGFDLTRVPLLERRNLLRSALAGGGARVRFSEHFDAPVGELLRGACGKGLEGLIGKRADAPYASRRSSAWIKLKCHRRQEFVIGGYTDPRGSRVGFGSLLLGVHDEAGRLVYAGNVGTGFDDKRLRSLHARLRALASPKDPFHRRPRSVKGHWVRPRMVAEVSFTEWTGDGRVRHPVFHALRSDKEPRAITREPALHEGAEPARGSAPAAAPRKRPVPAPSASAGIRITHGERVIDAATGATKLDLVRYYERIAPHMLPHLVGRPVALVRAPTGIGGELFFQKHGEKLRIPGIRTLDRSFWPGHAPMLEVATREGLVGAAQMNVVELHTWNSTTADITHPDRVIFDLDPGEGVGWEALKEGTALTRKMLELLGLESFLKTSGGKGLHVVVPLDPNWDYEAVRDFSAAVVRH